MVLSALKPTVLPAATVATLVFAAMVMSSSLHRNAVEDMSVIGPLE